jgi:hypothetical protein
MIGQSRVTEESEEAAFDHPPLRLVHEDQPGAGINILRIEGSGEDSEHWFVMHVVQLSMHYRVATFKWSHQVLGEDGQERGFHQLRIQYTVASVFMRNIFYRILRARAKSKKKAKFFMDSVDVLGLTTSLRRPYPTSDSLLMCQ